MASGTIRQAPVRPGTYARNSTVASTGSRSRGAGSRAGDPRWSRPSTRSPRGMPTASRPARRPQHAGSAPVRGEPALGGGEQHDRERRGRRADVLLVLDEAACQHGGDEDERRRPVELRRLLRAADLLQPRQRLRPEHAEAPRLREVVVRREPGEVEQLQQRLARNRLRPELLVRPPRADELREVHALRRAGRRRRRRRRRARAGSRTGSPCRPWRPRPGAPRRRARPPSRACPRARRRSGGPAPRPRP